VNKPCCDSGKQPFRPARRRLRYWTFPWFRIDDFESFARTMTLLKFPKELKLRKWVPKQNQEDLKKRRHHENGTAQALGRVGAEIVWTYEETS